ncbi:MAG: ribonuclease HII [Pelosinus sp.]|nr:ribonuclease HII [Pelosinus sp.]
MNRTSMTVADITGLLAKDEVSLESIALFKQDKRISVKRLIERWQQRQAQIAADRARVAELYVQEHALIAEGCTIIAGVDEAGRGPLAGPVVVGSVILPADAYLPLLNDSKKLTAEQRNKLYFAIKEQALAVNYEIVDREEIDRVNIYQATIAGMYRVIAGLKVKPEGVLIDAVPLPELSMTSVSLIGGDAISASIAAASIIAKVERDRLMMELDKEYPMYGFARHKGYGTKEHIAAIRKYGPCPIHRRSFEPIKSWEAKS